MRKVFLFILLVTIIFCYLLFPSRARVQTMPMKGKYQGIAQKGAKVVKTSSVLSYTLMETFPSCTITVYKTGTLTLANLYTNSTGTVKSNPFTANSDASYKFLC
jgi:hypothetical protein